MNYFISGLTRLLNREKRLLVMKSHILLERFKMVTIHNFTIDGNLVAKKIEGKIVRFHHIGDVRCVIVNLGSWGQFSFDINDKNIEIH